MHYEEDLKKKRERDKEEEAQKVQDKGKDAKGKDAKDKGGKDKKADAKKDDKQKGGNENIAKAEKQVIRDYKPIGMFKQTSFKELTFTRNISGELIETKVSQMLNEDVPDILQLYTKDKEQFISNSV